MDELNILEILEKKRYDLKRFVIILFLVLEKCVVRVLEGDLFLVSVLIKILVEKRSNINYVCAICTICSICSY